MSGEVSKLYLNPAELIIAEQPAQVITILGSCVAVAIHAPRLGIGSICHAVLPSGKSEEPAKFVDQSVRYMLNAFRNRGITHKELIAKLFGGSDMFELVNPAKREETIGSQNVRVALQCLQEAGIRLTASDTGGQRGRKLIFFSHTGEVLLKRLKKEQLPPQERRVTPVKLEGFGLDLTKRT